MRRPPLGPLFAKDETAPTPPSIALARDAGRGATSHAAFTLVEVLLTVAVTALLVVFTAQLINNTSRVVTLSNKRLDADSGARIAFTRMGADIDGMIRRPDADCFFVKNPGNDAFYFYSQTVGYYDGTEGPHTPLAFVGYRIANRANPTAVAPNGMLERVGVGLGYDNALPGKIARFLTYPAATAATPAPLPLKESTIAWTQGTGDPAGGNKIGTAPSWDNPDFQIGNQALLSAEIFRLEFCFLLDDGTYYTLPQPGPEPWNNAAFMTAMRRVRQEAVALVVTIALLDEKSQALVSRTSMDTPDFSKVIAAFADDDTSNAAAVWKSTLESCIASPGTIINTLGMPVAAASQIRIYQRAFPFLR